MYLVLCEKPYPKKLAFSFLEELTKEFEVLHGDEIGKASQPYQFITFGIIIYNSSRITQKLTSVGHHINFLSIIRHIHSKNQSSLH
jgi:vesicle transport protein SEC22